MTVPILCTVGSGLEDHAVEEIRNLPVTDISQLRGRILFNVEHNCLPMLCRLTLVERVFLRIFYRQIESPIAHDSLAFTIVRTLREHDWSVYVKWREDWLNTNMLHIGDLNDIIYARLFVKLRPKFLIRQTKKVHAEVSNFIENHLNLQISCDSALEISLMLSDSTLFLGLHLTKTRLSKRPYISHLGLRSTTASALLLNLGNGVLFDPMCGKGSILCEALARSTWNWKPFMPERVHQSFSFVIGSDCDLGQLMYAKENISNINDMCASGRMSWDLILCAAQKLPLRWGAVDHLVCDLPFGQKYNILTETPKRNDLCILYNILGASFTRILHDGSNFSLLLNEEHVELVVEALAKAIDVSMTVIIRKKQSIPLGLTKAVLLTGYLDSTS